MSPPTFYIMQVGEYPDGDSREALKLGTTWHAESRKSPFATTHTRLPTYLYLFELDPACFPKHTDLYSVDSIAFRNYLRRRSLDHINVKTSIGSGNEFYWKDIVNLADLVREFLNTTGLRIVRELTVDPYPIRIINRIERIGLTDEDYERDIVNSIFQRFCAVFLPNRIPRRIQTELWHAFELICATTETIAYKGIVQWPTGTGKTIAMLMLIVIAAERAKRNGNIYRGLLITVKNDVFKTISHVFAKLSEFGIDVYDGSEGRLSSITLPCNRACIVFATRCALTYDGAMSRLPNITHLHFDEVHGITAEKFYSTLILQLKEWSTEIVTGTSATPETCSNSQREKLHVLFGGAILHKCDVDEAVREGWIAPPKFHISIIEKNDTILAAFSQCVLKTIAKKHRGGKYIVYVETSKEDAQYVHTYLQQHMPPDRVYSALDGNRTDKEFCSALVDSLPRVLVACQRYQEGSDIAGLEMTSALVGDTIAAHRMIQKAGRSLRNDYPDKEGWFQIVRPSDPGTTEEDVLDAIVLDIMEFLGDRITTTSKDVEAVVRSYFGYLEVNGMEYDVNSTIRRVQAAYLRRKYTRQDVKERYCTVRDLNRELGLTSRNEYVERSNTHPKYVDDPESYFRDCWTNWYDFLGMDTSVFPQTKNEWIRVCKEIGLTTWEEYKQKHGPTLPASPGEMYKDYTNWDAEFGLEEEIVW